MMNKISVVALAFFAAIGLFAAVPNTNAAEIPLLILGSHPVIDITVDNIKARLEKSGHKVKVYNPNMDKAMMQQMARQIATEKHKLAIAVSTPAASTLIAAVRGRFPVMFAVALDPSAILGANKTLPANVAGIYGSLDYEKTAILIRKLMPQAKRVGLPFATGEGQSAFNRDHFMAALKAQGLQGVPAGMSSAADLRQVATQLFARTDCLIAENHIAMSNIGTLVEIGAAQRKPVFAVEEGGVLKGALAGYSADFASLGIQAGDLALEIVSLGHVPANPLRLHNKSALKVNRGSAKRLGIKIAE